LLQLSGMSHFLLDNYRWIIPVWVGGLMLIVFVRWKLENRRWRREDEAIRRWLVKQAKEKSDG
jgi:hypothetical protein